MEEVYHILNGDALDEQLPDTVVGTRIVMRECLVDGDVTGADLETFFSTRAEFLHQDYGVSREQYHARSARELKRILDIPADAEVVLWFEDDLFCQVNFWFVAKLLIDSGEDHKVCLIRPGESSPYYFAGLRPEELTLLLERRSELAGLEKIAALWKLYQENELDELLLSAQALETSHAFILPAVEAHIARKPLQGFTGRPLQTVKAIAQELQTDSFPMIFQAFQQRAAIYGYGDLQVKRLLERTSKEWQAP